MKRRTFIAAAPVASASDPVKYKGLAHLSALYVPWSNGWSIMGKVFKKRKRIKPTAPQANE
jgi:hypothetical protein